MDTSWDVFVYDTSLLRSRYWNLFACNPARKESEVTVPMSPVSVDGPAESADSAAGTGCSN